MITKLINLVQILSIENRENFTFEYGMKKKLPIFQIQYNKKRMNLLNQVKLIILTVFALQKQEFHMVQPNKM